MALQLILGRRSSSRRTVGFLNRVSEAAGEPIFYSGDGHVMTLAPTGTGKTSGPVICNALTHKGQLVAIDVKGEIHAATAEARRKLGQEIHVLDLREDPLPGSLNPLDLIAHGGSEPAVLARGFAAEMIERPSDERERFWSDWSESMLTGGISWLLADCPSEKRRLGALFDLFNHDDVDYELALLLDQKGKVRDRAAKAVFAAYLQLPDSTTRPSVLGTTQTHLRLFDSELARRLTDTTSFDVAGFVSGAPMSLYIIVPPSRLIAYRPLLRLWLSGLILAATNRATPPKERTLMLCDEIGNLGRIDAFLTAATLLRSWGLTLWTFWQNLAQLQIYGSQANTLIDNAGVLQIFGAPNLRAAQEIASVLGGMSGEQILCLPRDEQILLVEGKLMRCKQVRFYNDELFR